MTKKMLSLALVVLMLLSASAPAFAASDGNTLRHGVALIEVGLMLSKGSWVDPVWVTENPFGSRGTGFFVGKPGEKVQYLVTNRHVVETYLQLGQGEAYQVEYQGEQWMGRAQIHVHFDANDYMEAYIVEYGDTETKDIAILRLQNPTDKRAGLPICIPTQEMSDPNSRFAAVGFPGVADNEAVKASSRAGEKNVVITDGTINALFTETATGIPYLQHNAIIHHGNSGGPLVDLNTGAVVGINTSYYNSSSASAALYYAISMEFVKPYLDRNNVPYELVGEKNPPPPHNWLLYGILGAAILGVVVMLIVLLRRPKNAVRKPSDIVTPPQPPQPVSRVLIGVEGPLKDKRYIIEKGKAIYIGRDRNKCKVLFPNQAPGVSNVHCKISFDGKTATITDLKSSYGTAVDGKKLTPNTPMTLHRGLAIDIGSKDNRFTLQ